MGYVFDGEVGSAKSGLKRKSAEKVEPPRKARRVALAGVLLVLAVALGLWVGAFGLLALAAREPWFLAPAVPACPLAVVAGWIGARLWTGRPLPGGFVVVGMLAVGLVPFVGAILLVGYLALAVVATAVALP